jgi:hypothetical protein
MGEHVHVRFLEHAARHIHIFDETDFERLIALWPRRTRPHQRRIYVRMLAALSSFLRFIELREVKK